jgi:hypothetical protein
MNANGPYPEGDPGAPLPRLGLDGVVHFVELLHEFAFIE